MALAKVSRVELLNVLKRISPALGSDKEGFSRAVAFSVQEDKLLVFSKNTNYRFCGEVPLMNKVDKIERPFCFEMAPFYQFLFRVKDEIITFHEDGSKIVINTLLGRVIFENYRRMSKKLLDDDFWNHCNYPVFEGKMNSLKEVVMVASKTGALTVLNEYKRCAIKDKKAYFWYGNVLIIVNNVNVPDFGFRFTDLATIKRATKDVHSFSTQTQLRDILFRLDNDFNFSIPFCKVTDVVGACKSIVKDDILSFTVPFEVFKDVLGVTSYVCGLFDQVYSK